VAPEGPAEQTSVISAIAPGVPPDDQESAEYGANGEGSFEPLPHGSALLVVRRGPNAGSRFLLDKELTTAGRHPESDIFLDDVTVSRRHAEFRREGAGFTVSDVGSLNGTYVNRDRIDSVELVSGDEVQIGKFRLVYLSGRAPEPAHGGAGAEVSR
jgi:hypothetical protein